jgi:hypothetical protein
MEAAVGIVAGERGPRPTGEKKNGATVVGGGRRRCCAE